MTVEQKDEMIRKALKTVEGRTAIGLSMEAPIRKLIEYRLASEEIIWVDDPNVKYDRTIERSWHIEEKLVKINFSLLNGWPKEFASCLADQIRELALDIEDAYLGVKVFPVNQPLGPEICYVAIATIKY